MKLFPAALICLLIGLSDSYKPSTRPAAGEEQCQRLFLEWKARFAEAGLSTVVAPPFVIAGDGSRKKLEQYRDQTILAAQRALRAMYFDHVEPEKPIFILLFESD